MFFFSSSEFVLLSAGVGSQSLVSSDNESEEEEGAERKPAEVTSLDEALRTVNDEPERQQEDFLRQNFETLAESSSTGSTTVNPLILSEGLRLKRRLQLRQNEKNISTVSVKDLTSEYRILIQPQFHFLLLSSAEQSRVLRLSMSSRFQAKGHNNR